MHDKRRANDGPRKKKRDGESDEQSRDRLEEQLTLLIEQQTDAAERAAIQLEACQTEPSTRGRPRSMTSEQRNHARREKQHREFLQRASEAMHCDRESRIDRRRARPRTRRPDRRHDAQRPLREVEHDARRHAVAAASWMLERGESMVEVAERLQLAQRTLRGWIEGVEHGRLGPKNRGRPVEKLSLAQRMEIIAVMTELGPQKTGLATFIGCFPGVARSALWDILCRYRELLIRRHAKSLWTLRWGVPGAVWAMDYAEPPAPIDGTYEYVFAVRDLASHCQLAWTPCENANSQTTICQLQELFARYGTPIVMKGDNGSPIASKAVRDFLDSCGVWFLASPPLTPNYNGAVEAGIGWMKARTEEHAALWKRAGRWTTDDCAAAIAKTNNCGRPWGEHRPTPWEAFAARAMITQETRDAFSTEVVKWERTLSTARARRDPKPITRAERDQISRGALRTAMTAQGYLEVRRGRVTSPVAA